MRERAETAKPEVNTIPAMFNHRMLSVRAYDNAAMMRTAKVVPGTELEQTIREFFTNGDVAYLHVHNAAPGCFTSLVQRA